MSLPGVATTLRARPLTAHEDRCSPTAPPTRFLAALSLVTFLACAGTARFALGGIPHVQDEQAYLLQARIFAHFAAWAPAPPGGTALLHAAEFQELTPRWFGVFPPGWPLVLALGARLGVPWLVNPLLAAVLPWLAWAAFAPGLRREEAAFASAIATLSPGVLALGSSMMSHTLVLAALLAAVAAIRRDRPGLAGLAVGVVLLARPLDGVAAGGPLLLWAAMRARQVARDGRLGRLLWLAAGPAAAVGALLTLNDVYTGTPLQFAVDRYFLHGSDWGMVWRAGCNQLGFGPARGCMSRYERTGYTPAMAWTFFTANARFFDRLLLGVPGGGLAAVVGGGLLLRRRALPGPVAIAAIAVPLANGLYWYHGICYGARFWHPLYVLALPASAVALAWRPRIGAVILALGVGWTGTCVWRELADDYWCVPTGLAAALAEAGVDRGVVFLDSSATFTRRWPLTKYDRAECSAWYVPGAGLGQDDPFADSDSIVFLRAPSARALTQPGARATPATTGLDLVVAAAYPDQPVRSVRWEQGKWRVLPVATP